MRISVAFATLFAALSVLALPLTQRVSPDPSLSRRFDVAFSAEATLYIRATEAQKADRKARKEQQAINKAARVEKAKNKPKFRTHEQKIKEDKAKVIFSPGASSRLDAMGLHGKGRKAVKKFHKNIMKAQMRKNGATQGIIVSTAHTGGTVKDETNHITAKFIKGDPKSKTVDWIPSTWTDKKTGKVKEGKKDMHHVYVNDKLRVPSAWSKALDASHDRKKEAEEAKKAEVQKALDAKIAAAKLAGAAKSAARKEEKAAREKRPGII